jgi:hypothetical protein
MNMSVRPEVLHFAALGPLPESSVATEDDLNHRAAILVAIKPPLNRDEADILLTCFGPDECFGMAWTLLHLLETTPGGAVLALPAHDANEWVRLLWDRAHR